MNIPSLPEDQSNTTNRGTQPSPPSPGYCLLPTIAGDNSVDLFTNDLGLAATLDQDGKVEGYHVFVGVSDRKFSSLLT